MIIEVENTKLFKGFKSKKGALRKEFVEQEAELSGDSDDGLNISEDEDERGLDRLMLEEGDLDEECADEDELRDQVGRLHQRALLDQDQREIRLFQEAFLEDGELHSDATRTRKFRWKDTEEDIDLERRPSDDETEENEGATLQDEKWRLERREREKVNNGDYALIQISIIMYNFLYSTTHGCQKTATFLNTDKKMT